MAKKSKRHPSNAKSREALGPRISVDDALRLLLPFGSPHAAAERLHAAWRDNRVRLWCNETVVPPNFIRTDLVLQLRFESDGRPRAVIEPTRTGWENTPYVFEVDEAEVLALLPAAPKRRAPGRRPTGNWPMLIHREMKRMGRKHVAELQNLGELRDQLEGFLKRKIGFYPQDPKALNAKIKAFLEG